MYHSNFSFYRVVLDIVFHIWDFRWFHYTRTTSLQMSRFIRECIIMTCISDQSFATTASVYTHYDSDNDRTFLAEDERYLQVLRVKLIGSSFTDDLLMVCEIWVIRKPLHKGQKSIQHTNLYLARTCISITFVYYCAVLCVTVPCCVLPCLCTASVMSKN